MAAKHGNDNGLNIDGESRAFWDGFAKYMRELESVLGPSADDSLDY